MHQEEEDPRVPWVLAGLVTTLLALLLWVAIVRAGDTRQWTTFRVTIEVRTRDPEGEKQAVERARELASVIQTVPSITKAAVTKVVGVGPDNEVDFSVEEPNEP